MPAGEESQASSSIWYQCSDLSQYWHLPAQYSAVFAV